jgi:hypothetical protein
MNENYGLTGSVHTLEQRRPWKYGLDRLPNRESFDVEFSPTGRVRQHTDYTNAEDVHRISRFSYDGADKLMRAVEFDRTGVAVSFSEFEYSEAKRVCITRDATGIVTGSNVNVFNGDFLTLLGTYDANDRPKRLKSFEYTQGKLSWAVSEYYGLDGTLSEIAISRFDLRGRVVEAFGLTPDGKPTGDGRYTYEYDDEGRTHKCLSFNDFDEEDIPSSIKGFTYECDEQGNWTERCEYYRSRGDSDWTRRMTTRRLTYYLVG